MIVTGGGGFFSDERADAVSEVNWIAPGVPGFRLHNTCRQGRYAIEKTVIADPRRHVLLQRTKFLALQRAPADYRLFVQLAHAPGRPRTRKLGALGDYKGQPMLMAEIAGCALALACSLPWVCRNAGFAGRSGGRNELAASGQLRRLYDLAECGNVSLIGEVGFADAGEFVLAVGFGRNVNEAGHRARASLGQGFDAAYDLYSREWNDWHESLATPITDDQAAPARCRTDAAVLAIHESKDFSGGVIASLSLPWGEIHGDKDIGGYHLVWPRDAYESASALLALGRAR